MSEKFTLSKGWMGVFFYNIFYLFIKSIFLNYPIKDILKYKKKKKTHFHNIEPNLGFIEPKNFKNRDHLLEK